jgi:DMSO/TMAO reductase YedYZ heme-binding membrane subunit
LKKNLPVAASLFNTKYWNFQSFFGWGLLGFFLALIVLLTSNKWAIKLLKKYWKPIQRLTYLLVLATAIHIGLVNPENKITSAIIVALLVLVWLLANRKIKLWK